MDKEVIFAVAGSGKTRRIVERLSLERRALVIAYTQNATEELSRRVMQKFGYMPDTVRVSTYFSFLDRFCYRPYLSAVIGARGITFKEPTHYSNRKKLTDDDRFMDASGRLYHCRLAQLLAARHTVADVVGRLERYFDDVFVDEVQDFGGHDFKLLVALSKAAIKWQLVGDFYQHTYDTSRDQGASKGLHKDYLTYQSKLKTAGFRVDTTSLIESHRCSEEVCTFITDRFGIAMRSASGRDGNVRFVDEHNEAIALHADGAVLKLYVQEPYRWGGYSMTWGKSKGLDRQDDVCVVVNEATWNQIHKRRLSEAAPLTRSKLYVACTRARRHLFVVREKAIKHLQSARIVKADAKDQGRKKPAKRAIQKPQLIKGKGD